MGWCVEFACNINPACDCRMVAGERSCSCPECGVVCKGRYAGCRDVWAAGPRRSRGRRPPLPGRFGAKAESPPAAAPPPAVVVATDVAAVADLQASVDQLRQELGYVLTMMSQQQAILALLVERGRPDGPTTYRPEADVERSALRVSAFERAVEALLPRTAREVSAAPSPTNGTTATSAAVDPPS